MSNSIQIKQGAVGYLSQKVSDYAMLTKFRLSFLVVFSAVIGYLFAGSTTSLTLIFWLSMGGMLVTGASNAINQIIEKDIDKLMKRTQNRPIATGRMSTLEAILAAGVFGIVGILILTVQFNPIAGVLSAISLLSYAFVYTPLKRVHPVAVFVGAIPGALPPMIGYVCATGVIDFTAILLFSIQFIWQFPHFWAIAWLAYDDYAKAGYYLLPNRIKDRLATRMTVFYALWMVLISLLPAFGLAGTLTTSLWASIATGVLGLDVMYHAVQHFRRADDASARALMFSTIRYLPLVQTLWVVDRFIQ
jgi:protoheme IX farnesyltransferase